MAIAGGARPSVRCAIVNGHLVVDSQMMRQVDVISTPYNAIDALRAGQIAYVQTYGDNLKIVRAAFVTIAEGVE